MVEQNKSLPEGIRSAGARESRRYKESWMDDPSKALRVQGLLALAIIGGVVLAGEGWFLPKERQQEQDTANYFLRQQADTVTKTDLTVLETTLATKAELETAITEIKQMLSENARRPVRRPVLKKTDNSLP